NRFWAREAEKDSLFAQVSSTNLLVVYGKSGVGKTSLLQAGLVPRLRQNNFFPVYARIENDPVDAVQDYVLKALGPIEKYGLTRTANLPEFLGETTEFLRRKRSIEEEEKPLVIILDQFEDFFGTYLENGIEDKRSRFIRELAQIIYNRDLPVVFVFAMREDFLPEMAIFKTQIPSILNNYYRLTALIRENAKEAITQPLVGTRVQLEDRLVKRLLDDLQKIGDGGIEPYALQMVCSHIWDQWKAQGELVPLAFYTNTLHGLQTILGEFV